MKWLNRCSQRRAYNCTSFKELLRHFQIERPRIVGRPKPALRHEGTRTAASTAQACLRKRVSLKSLVRDLRLHARICAGAVGQLAVLPRWQARVTTMSERESHIQHLFAAEVKFRLASAVRLAVTGNRQPLDLPIEWTHGQHRVRYEEIALRQDQADYAAFLLQRSATLTMAVAIKDAIEAVAPGLPKAVRKAKNDVDRAIRDVIQAVEPKPWKSSDNDVVTAYHIARLIRNAYSHAPFAPTWMIHAELQDKVFAIPGVIELRTTGLHQTAFDWRHYGGPLALFRLCRFVRTEILNDQPAPRKVVPISGRMIYQQGDLILEKVDAIPPNAVPVEDRKRPDGGIDLGGGHVLYPG